MPAPYSYATDVKYRSFTYCIVGRVKMAEGERYDGLNEAGRVTIHPDRIEYSLTDEGVVSWERFAEKVRPLYEATLAGPDQVLAEMKAGWEKAQRELLRRDA